MTNASFGWSVVVAGRKTRVGANRAAELQKAAKAKKAAAKRAHIRKAKAKRTQAKTSQPSAQVSKPVKPQRAQGFSAAAIRSGKPQAAAFSIDLEQLHNSLTGDQAVVLLEAWRDAAALHCASHCSAKGLAPYFMESGFLRRFAYVVINAFLAAGQEAAFETSLTNAKRRVPSGAAVKETRYRIGLAALLPAQDADELRYIAYQLEYAWRHYVPAEFLVGFLRQSGPTASAEAKVKSKAVEPWFSARSWDGDKGNYAAEWVARSGLE